MVPGASRTASVSHNNTSVLMLAPVDDIPGLASRIDFGKATVNGNRIAVQVSPEYVASVPQPPAEQPGQAVHPGRTSGDREPEIPPDADAVTKSLIQLSSTETHTKKDGLNRLMRTPPDDRLAEVVQAVIPLLDDDDGWLVGDAIKVLVIWKSPDAVPALISARTTIALRSGMRRSRRSANSKIRAGSSPLFCKSKTTAFRWKTPSRKWGRSPSRRSSSG